MTQLDAVDQSLQALGFRESGKGTYEAPPSLGMNTQLLRFSASEESDGLRLEAQMMEQVTRNKIALWNIIHHNNAFLPFGQFYISPANTICFGLKIPHGAFYTGWLTFMIYQLILVAESYLRIIENDFQQRNFNEEALQMNVLNLFRSEMQVPAVGTKLSQPEAASMLEHHLQEFAGPEHVIRVNDREFALTDHEYPLTITLEDIPHLRRHKASYDWHIGIHVEVGVLDMTDDRLWIYFNRLNHESFMMAYGIRYTQRRPLVTLKTALIPPLLQQPEMVRNTLARFADTAPKLFEELASPYKIRNVVDYKLGL
jgi:hypothetical protein